MPIPPEDPVRKLPPLHALRAFEAAARHLHFAHAADELGLTPTAISHQVRQLEANLGVELFCRFPRPVRLTVAGKTLFPVLRTALDQIAGTVNQLSVNTAETPLRLSVTMAFASRWLMPRLPDLRAQTGLSLTIEAADLPADLHASDIDMAIRYAEQPDPNATWVRLFPDRIIPVCTPNLAPGRLPFSPARILALPLLHYRWKTGSSNTPSWDRWHAASETDTPLPPVTQHFSEEIHAIDAAVSGQGAVLASQHLVSDLLASGQLVQLSDIALPGLTYWAVFLSTHPETIRLKHLLVWLQLQR